MTTSPNCSSCRLHAGSDTKVSEYRVHCSLFCLDLDSHRPVRVPMLIAIHLKHQQWVCELQNWTTEHWKKVNDEPHFLLHQVHRLPGNMWHQDSLWEECKPAEAVWCFDLLGHRGSRHPCGCYCDTYHLPKYSCRPCTLFNETSVTSFYRIMCPDIKPK